MFKEGKKFLPLQVKLSTTLGIYSKPPWISISAASLTIIDVWCEKKKDMDLLLGNKIDAHLLFIK